MDGITPQDIDMMTRTVIGEAGDQSPEGQAAVAHVILNRVASGKYGDTPTQVVLAPHQFEPWAQPQKMMAYSPDSPAYQQARGMVENAVTGTIPDPTDGATHFYAPVAQKALGRKTPDWAKPEQKTAEIGGHRFYAPEGKVNRDDDDDMLDAWRSKNKPTTIAPAQEDHFDDSMLDAWHSTGKVGTKASEKEADTRTFKSDLPPSVRVGEAFGADYPAVDARLAAGMGSHGDAAGSAASSEGVSSKGIPMAMLGGTDSDWAKMLAAVGTGGYAVPVMRAGASAIPKIASVAIPILKHGGPWAAAAAGLEDAYAHGADVLSLLRHFTGH
jgi:hypothetical protein